MQFHVIVAENDDARGSISRLTQALWKHARHRIEKERMTLLTSIPSAEASEASIPMSTRGRETVLGSGGDRHDREFSAEE